MPSAVASNNDASQNTANTTNNHNTANTSKTNNFLHLTDIHLNRTCPCHAPDHSPVGAFRRRQSQQSNLAKYAMQSSTTLNHQHEHPRPLSEEAAQSAQVDQLRDHLGRTLSHQNGSQLNGGTRNGQLDSAEFKTPPTHLHPRGSLAAAMHGQIPEVTGATMAMNDTPAPTSPNSPRINGAHSTTSSDGTAPFSLGSAMQPTRSSVSGSSTPRVRPTTLDIPGLTKSKVSPDGRIAQRDVGAKLVIVMVGLPARGKSYITKKLARYLNWLQHDCRIFNVGERRRNAAGGPLSPERSRTQQVQAIQELNPSGTISPCAIEHLNLNSPVHENPPNIAQIMLNDDTKLSVPSTPSPKTVHDPLQLNGNTDHDRHTNHDRQDDRDLHMPDFGEPSSPTLSRRKPSTHSTEAHDAAFFDPDNHSAAQIREYLARETLDELLDYILDQNGSVGILDATNSTPERRKMVMDIIRERAGPALNVLFLESRCVDQDLLEANMRLKLSGPDYKDMDPTVALADFKERVRAYEKAYIPLGEYEERHNIPYIQMIDVGRKVISHQIKGFLMAQANYYLLNFNLSPRQIWITRHGLSMDNISGKIGGDSDLAPEGHQYAKSLTRFIDEKRREWDLKQLQILENSHFPPQPGDVTPPNPHYQPMSPSATSDSGSNAASDGTDISYYDPKPFCVWTSMLKRSIQTAAYFDDEIYDTKQMRMLDELNAGVMEGLTYSCISTLYPEEYAHRKKDKMHYRYPGPGGEGYLDIINRLRPVIVELERMTDHVLLVGHRSVARVLLAYFRGLKRDEVADLDVPLGILFCLEPKPYGVDFKAYRWDKATEWFYEVPDFKLQRAPDDMQ